MAHISDPSIERAKRRERLDWISATAVVAFVIMVFVAAWIETSMRSRRYNDCVRGEAQVCRLDVYGLCKDNQDCIKFSTSWCLEQAASACRSE